jgi:hypothetical protein
VYEPRKLVDRELEAVGWVSLLKPPAEMDVLLDTPDLVTGHMVVEMAMVEVRTLVESAGQLVTVAAQLVTVTSLVV